MFDDLNLLSVTNMPKIKTGRGQKPFHGTVYILSPCSQLYFMFILFETFVSLSLYWDRLLLRKIWETQDSQKSQFALHLKIHQSRRNNWDITDCVFSLLLVNTSYSHSARKTVMVALTSHQSQKPWWLFTLLFKVFSKWWLGSNNLLTLRVSLAFSPSFFVVHQPDSKRRIDPSALYD